MTPIEKLAELIQLSSTMTNRVVIQEILVPEQCMLVDIDRQTYHVTMTSVEPV